MKLWTAIKMTLVVMFLTGIVYPLLMVAIAQAIFPFQANGSLIVRDGQVIGSRLIGQNFDAPQYFHPRPSAAGDKGYDADNSGGSNLGPTNKLLIKEVRPRLAKVLGENPGISAGQVPVDLVTASASGLDPDISPAAAAIQVARVAKARGIPPAEVAALVHKYTQSRFLGIFGAPRVNVVMLNLALDNLKRTEARPGAD
jgi:K+-transporting ATPase ATPase C chain